MKAKIGKYLKNKKSKVSVEIDHFDTYSLDYTLALIILPALIALKNSKQGIPIEFGDVGGDQSSLQMCFDFYNESHGEAFEIGIEKWEEVLDKIIWSFQQIAEDNYSNLYHHGEEQFSVKTNKEGNYELINLNPHGYWHDTEGHDLHESRIQEGLELFGKYYTTLWS